jgi:hypothetical protein
VKTCMVRIFLLWLLWSTPILFAQTAPEGIWQGYAGEWKHVSQQLIAPAEATPVEKFAWRPGPGVRSTSEVYLHIAMANFYLLSVTGPKRPKGGQRKNGYGQGRSNRLAEALAGRSKRGSFGGNPQ